MTTNSPKKYLNKCDGTYVPPKLAAPPPPPPRKSSFEKPLFGISNNIIPPLVPPPKKDYAECKSCLEQREKEQLEEIKKRLAAGVYKDHAEYSINVTSRVINIIDTEHDIRLLLKIIEG